jgi:hypothetical protein
MIQEFIFNLQQFFHQALQWKLSKNKRQTARSSLKLSVFACSNLTNVIFKISSAFIAKFLSLIKINLKVFSINRLLNSIYSVLFCRHLSVTMNESAATMKVAVNSFV